MSIFSRSISMLTVGLTVALLAALTSAPAFAKTIKVDCTKGGILQKSIDAAVAGDTVEITGICMTNVIIKDKALTLIGAASGGPHGITGTAALTDGVRIENSRGTHIEGLTISNPLSTGVRMLGSVVTMTNCEVSNSGVSVAGRATGIWVQELSNFTGTRLRLDGNRHGLAAVQSRAFCRACDLNGNTQSAALSNQYSLVSLLDSEVTGSRGIWANLHSYIDIDCISYVSDPVHTCSLNSTGFSGQAFTASTVAFYESGDFSGSFFAGDRSSVQFLGARQQAAPADNGIDDNSSLLVSPGDTGFSRLIGTTNVHGFSNALIYGAASTELDGSLNCDAGGDAWVEPGVVLDDFTITGCDHAPP